MTRKQFNAALVKLNSGKRLIAYMSGEEHLHIAILQAISKGPRAFKSPEKLRNYVSMRAKGSKRDERDNLTNRANLMSLHWWALQPHIEYADTTARLDVEKHTRYLEPDLRDAVRAYLLEEADIETAATYLKNPVRAAERILAVVKRLLDGPLNAYK
jgi:hypothetical protein